MRNIKANPKIIAFLLAVTTLTSTINSAIAITPEDTSTVTSTATSIIPLGNWSLGDTFIIKYGQDILKTYSYNDILNLYNSNCYESQNNEVSLQNNDLQYQQYFLQYNSICDNIQNYKKLVEQYSDLAKTYEDEMNASTGTQKDSAQQNMLQSLLTAQSYRTELATAVSQKAEIYANRESCLYVKNNIDTYRKQQYISQNTDFRNSVYELKLLDEKYYLQRTYAEYSKLNADAKSINKSKDISFQTDVDLYNSDYDYYTNQQELINQQFNNQFEKLLNNSNIKIQGVTINTNIKDIRGRQLISYNTFENNCIENDIKKKQLDDKLRILDGKVTILKEYYPDTSNEVRLAQNEKSQASLELSKWLTQRKNTLQNAYAIYKSKYNEIGINEKKAKAMYEKFIIMKNKYNYGLSNMISVKEAELNYMQSSLTAWNTLYEYSNALGNVEKYMSGNIQ